MTPSISVLVPVYNVRKYLEQCIDSIVSQTFQNFELILVDDGSTDGSGDICDHYASSDSRIQAIHKSNEGLASARKEAIKVAKGKYLAFIDSDDWIEKNGLEDMYTMAVKEDADIVLCDYYMNKKNDQKYVTCKPSTVSDNNTIIIETLQAYLHAGLWCKLFRRQLFVDYDVYSPKNSYYEDMHAFISALHYTNKIVYYNKAFYHYRFNDISYTNNVNSAHRFKMYFEFMANMIDLNEKFALCNDKYIYKAFIRRINHFKTNIAYNFCDSPQQLSKALDIMPESITFKGIETKKDFFLYFASKYGIFFPFRLIRWKDQFKNNNKNE